MRISAIALNINVNVTSIKLTSKFRDCLELKYCRRDYKIDTTERQ